MSDDLPLEPAPPESLLPTREVPVVRVSTGGIARTVDAAAAEEPLDVRLHGRSFAIVMRTPGEDRELAAGFLLSERLIDSADDIGAIEHCRHPDLREAHHVVDVYLRGAAAARVPQILERRRETVANSSCGVCGRATIDELLTGVTPLTRSWTMELETVRRLPGRLRERQARFEETGGLHAAAIVTPDGVVLSSAEDVGRHNAVDKAVGRLLLADAPAGPRALVVSGRVSFEIVQKAWLAGAGVVVAISAPTSLAVELARDAGITLIGFVRDESLNIYTHIERVAGL